MRLIAFSVQKYRSIQKTPRLRVQSLTTILGPNNEGKSNLLHAIVAALQLLPDIERVRLFGARGVPPAVNRKRVYEWSKDFPIGLQAKHPDGESIFDLEFALDEKELSDFRKEVKSSLNGTLPVRVSIGKGSPGFRVRKQGRGGPALSTKAVEIATFVGRRFQFEYIPAVRNSELALSTLRGLVSAELRKLGEHAEFKAILKQLRDVQQPTLVSMSDGVTATVREFLPSIRSVRVRMSDDFLASAVARSFEIVVDDGTPTALERKGDGVQSLVTLGLLRYASNQWASGKSLIFAIEEPESHLHHGAVHQLREVLRDISSKNQVVLTTHSPVFVNRGELPANILVVDNQASPASSASELRDALGVRASDNLRNAEVMLIVEGENDRTAMSAVLSRASSGLKAAIAHGTLAIDTMIGGSNFSYKLVLLRDSMCLVHGLLDNDETGRAALERAEAEGLLTRADCSFTICPGMSNSEIEDLYDVEVYSDYVWRTAGVKLNVPKFRHSRSKWSDRMKETFSSQGQVWDERFEKKLKAGVAELIAQNSAAAVKASCNAVVQSLVAALEAKLSARA
jgi:putative ATP-dependent endonuclease of the OLD family